MKELRDEGLVGGIPVDPDGYPYIFGQDGKSQLNPRSSVVIPSEILAPPATVKWYVYNRFSAAGIPPQGRQ